MAQRAHRPDVHALRSIGQRKRARTCSCRKSRQQIARLQASKTEADIVVVGGGIIGLSVAFQLLNHASCPSVTLLERRAPCSGATGAGQGYVWLAHREPKSPGWAIAKRSKQLWEDMLHSSDTAFKGQQLSLGSKTDIEWQENGSMLLASDEYEANELQERAEMLQHHGIRAAYHSQSSVKQLEPALQLPEAGGALLVESDTQLSGRRAAEVLMQRCRETAGTSGRFQAHLHEPVEQLHMSSPDNAVTGVSTATRRVSAAQGVVLAAGAWSGHLLSSAMGDNQWQEVFKPRRGHLLELQLPHGMPPLHHGLMESSYRQHLHKDGPLDSSAPDVSFTATPSASGTCLLGSAREFKGWDVSPSDSIIKAILQRASTFLPDLQGYSITSSDDVRVGLRPYALGGLPFIGPVIEVPGLYLAAGHEGAGLTMAPATAELIMQHVMHERIALGEFADEFLPSHRMQAALAGLTSTFGHA